MHSPHLSSILQVAKIISNIISFIVFSRERQIKMNPNLCRFCRLQNKQVNDCIFASLFPSNDLRKFTIMNLVFGPETLTFFLKDLSHMDRKYTTRTLYFEGSVSRSMGERSLRKNSKFRS
ncbi:hypothetical protein ARALYDRAFT_905051 [Arabidopsis lyrata subsp. lyrata]|uniref:LOB domain-containing protein n=1 Tax=Arabidopsis lyrata subsp. lyrata TaxID=81972 RepID=D7LPM5_ARALL|nr:hypothetical protein ARALYDRAFT_905051 [Arabidopsis lyrata subsp. lyrata]